MTKFEKLKAFTLAEVLITLAIIGVVALLTIPALIENHNTKAWATAKDLWQKKLVEITRRMNVDGVMTGYSTTEDFMDTFQKYLKVIKTCDNNNINTCYSPKVVRTGKDGEIEVETSDLKTAYDLGLNDFGTRTISFVVTDGTTVIMAYNPKCPEVDPFSQKGQAGQTSCMAMMIDVNGKKGPNHVGKDIQLSGGVSFSTCDNPIGNYCWSMPLLDYPAIDTCDGKSEYDKDTGSEVQYYCSANYWAGAKKFCDEKGMELPTMEQLADIASIIYGKKIEPYKNYGEASYGVESDGILLEYHPEEWTFTFNMYYYWSSEQDPDRTSRVYERNFSNFSSYSKTIEKNSSYPNVICVAK